MSMKTKEDDKKSSSPEVEKSRSRGVEKVKNRMLDRGMPAIGDAAVGSSASELLDFSTFLNERTLNVYENKRSNRKSRRGGPCGCPQATKWSTTGNRFGTAVGGNHKGCPYKMAEQSENVYENKEQKVN